MSVESSKGGILRCRAVLFAILAALLYAVSTPVSKLLLVRIPPTPLFWIVLAIMAVGTVVVTQDSLKA